MELSVVLATLATPWVLYAIASSFGDALVGYIDEWLLNSLTSSSDDTDAPGKLILISGFFGVITALCVVLVQLLLPATVHISFFEVGVLIGIAAGMIEVIWLIPYFHAIHKSGALDAAPILQTIPIFALLIGIFFYQEIPSTLQLIGICTIFAGAIALNYAPQTRQIAIVPVFLMLLSSAIIAVGLFIFRDAAVSSNIATAIFGNGIGMFIMASLIWIAYPPYRSHFNSFISSIKPRTLLVQGCNESLYTISAIAGQVAVVLAPSVVLASAFIAFQPVFILLIATLLGFAGVQSYSSKLTGHTAVYKVLGILLITGGAFLIL